MNFPRVMVTGHRPQFLDGDQQLWTQRELERVAIKLRDQNGMQVGISGMALGADTWWGYATVFAWMDLWAFIPFPQQPDRWGDADRQCWNELRSRAKHEVIIANEYSVGALHARNDAMLLNADLVVAVWDPAKTTGGTASCVQKAVAAGKPILHVNPIAQSTMMLAPGRMPS